MNEAEWNDIYKKLNLTQIPWHSSQPDRYLVRLINDKKKCEKAPLGCLHEKKELASYTLRLQ